MPYATMSSGDTQYMRAFRRPDVTPWPWRAWRDRRVGHLVSGAALRERDREISGATRTFLVPSPCPVGAPRPPVPFHLASSLFPVCSDCAWPTLIWHNLGYLPHSIHNTARTTHSLHTAQEPGRETGFRSAAPHGSDPRRVAHKAGARRRGARVRGTTLL